MKRIISVCMAAMLFVIPMTQTFAQQNKVSLEEKARSLAVDFLASKGVSGWQYAIRDHGTIVLSDCGGVNDEANHESITKHTQGENLRSVYRCKDRNAQT